MANLNLLLSLVHDVLDLKVIESGKFVRNDCPFCPIDTLDFIKSMFEAQCEMQNTAIRFQTTSVDSIKYGFRRVPDVLSYESLPETLIGDNLRLKQVLINLTKNAMKFTPRGLVSIFAAFDHFDGLLYI